MIASSTGRPLSTTRSRRSGAASADEKRRIGHTPALRLRTHEDRGLRCLTALRIDFTNSEVELDLRMVKLRQKISGGFCSEQGARDFATRRAVIATARKQGWMILKTLTHPDPMQLSPDGGSESPPAHRNSSHGHGRCMPPLAPLTIEPCVVNQAAGSRTRNQTWAVTNIFQTIRRKCLR